MQSVRSDGVLLLFDSPPTLLPQYVAPHMATPALSLIVGTSLQRSTSCAATAVQTWNCLVLLKVVEEKLGRNFIFQTDVPFLLFFFFYEGEPRLNGDNFFFLICRTLVQDWRC